LVLGMRALFVLVFFLGIVLSSSGVG